MWVLGDFSVIPISASSLLFSGAMAPFAVQCMSLAFSFACSGLQQDSGDILLPLSYWWENAFNDPSASTMSFVVCHSAACLASPFLQCKPIEPFCLLFNGLLCCPWQNFVRRIYQFLAAPCARKSCLSTPEVLYYSFFKTHMYCQMISHEGELFSFTCDFYNRAGLECCKPLGRQIFWCFCLSVVAHPYRWRISNLSFPL